jgi:hypothetical protein
MREVSIGIGRRRDPLVHLNDVHLRPGQLIAGQCTQQRPRELAAARAASAITAAALRATTLSSG